MFRKSSSHTVRPGSRYRVSKVLCVLVFAATNVVVYRWGLVKARRSEPVGSYSSTATICISGPAGRPVTKTRTLPDRKRIERRIASQAAVHRAARQLDPAIEPVRQNLRVTAAKASSPGEVAVSITYTDRCAEYAAWLVNTLAKDYARSCRAQWKERSQKAYVEAREALDRAQQESRRAKARLDAFCEHHFKQQAATSKESAQARTLPEPPMVDNPEWIEQNEQLAELQRRRKALLVDRTPVHPEVEQNAIRIAAVEHQLAAIPRKIPGLVASGSREGGTSSQPTPPADIAGAGELAQEFRALKEAADRAGKVRQQAARAERLAWQAQRQEPRIRLALATPCAVVSHPVAARSGLVLAALVAGLATTAGLGLIAVGFVMEPKLATVDQVQALLAVPIVGTVPESGPAAKSKLARRWRPLLRLTMIVGGLVLIAGCIGILARSLGGF